MPIPIIAGNWKMNTSISEAVTLATVLVKGLDPIDGVEKVLCPPFVSLESVSRIVSGTSVKLGAQNMYYPDKGAFTGEVSPIMLAGMCQYVILGHSERRHHFGESDELINLKIKATFEAGLRPILCVGESLEQREAGKASQTVKNQVQTDLSSLHNIDQLVIAYEPVWAIGTGVPATPETASEMMRGVILRCLAELYGDHAAGEVPLVYGGSVTPENVEAFVSEECIHGALVGGASLQAEKFVEIVRITAGVKGTD